MKNEENEFLHYWECTHFNVVPLTPSHGALKL